MFDYFAALCMLVVTLCGLVWLAVLIRDGVCALRKPHRVSEERTRVSSPPTVVITQRSDKSLRLERERMDDDEKTLYDMARELEGAKPPPEYHQQKEVR